MRRILILSAVLASLVAVVGVAVAYPPATLTSTQDAITVSGLDCGESYRLNVREQQADGTYGDSNTYFKATEACDPPPPPTDSDGDGVADSQDACPGTPAGTQVDAQGCPVTAGSWWKPPAKPTWYWQLQGTIRSTPWQVYDIDGADNQPYPGKLNVAYFSAGTAEDWRSDYSRFPSAAKGNNVDGWAGEKWLDVRRADVRQVMYDRMASFKAKGFLGVEPDNVDEYQQSSGFSLTAQDQLDYNRWLADTAHGLGLAVFLKNDVDQVQQLQPDFDGAINEQCQQYSECGAYAAFLDAGKPVLQAEYTTKTDTKCANANGAGRMLAFTNTALDGSKWQPCW